MPFRHCGYGIVWFNVPLDKLGHFGDGRVTAASARIVAAVSAEASSTAQPHSVRGGELCCATTVDNSGVWYALYPYILDARLGLWVSLEHTFTCVSTTNQAERYSSAAHLLATWEHKRTTARWSRAQVGGPSVILTACIHYKFRCLLT